MSSYIPHSVEERRLMLDFLGLESVDELFKDIDKKILLKKDLNLQLAKDEYALAKHMRSLSDRNLDLSRMLSFFGAGMYNHFIPAVVDHIVRRSEFYTAYTPYQAEVSQGTLQMLYEYQTLICSLTGMDVANATMYDGSTALAEATVMASNITGRKKILVSKTVHPEYRQVVGTYAKARDFTVEEIEYDSKNGKTSIEDLEGKIGGGEYCAVAVQNPNFFGILEDVDEIVEIAHNHETLLIDCIVEATSIGLIKPPKLADIVVGEGQSFGNPISFGGPHFGFLATKNDYMRKIPGRLVGATVDRDGRRGFVLTLQAREQHIRREKASSNICTAEVLNALAGTVYLSLLGREGLRSVAEVSHKKAAYAYKKLKEVDGLEEAFSNPAFYNEFAFKVPEDTAKRLMDDEIIGGFDLGRFYPELAGSMLFCVTETHSKEDIDFLADVMSK